MSATLARPSRVLLADHAADARLLTRTALAGIAGIEIVAEAVDGADAVEKAAACQPDLVLLGPA